MALSTSCIPLSAVRVDFVNVMSDEEMRKVRSAGKHISDFWSAQVIMATTYGEYEERYENLERYAKTLPIEFGEKQTIVLVYAPDVLDSRISSDTYVLYTWMLLNLLCPLEEHIRAKFKFDLDALIKTLSKHSPELPRWHKLRRDCEMLLGVSLIVDGEARLLETMCNHYMSAFGYINEQYVGEVFLNLFPTHKQNWFHLARAWFTNEADSVSFGLDTVDKWKKLCGNR